MVNNEVRFLVVALVARPEPPAVETKDLTSPVSIVWVGREPACPSTGTQPNMVYDESDCVEAVQEAARVLGKSPTQQEYGALDISPSHKTICRIVGWNPAKEAAGLDVVLPCHERPVSFYTDRDGYEQWATVACGEQKITSVHRLLAVAEYGFDAVVGQDVHHENEVPWDNRPENISLMDPGDHIRHHEPWKAAHSQNQ